MVYDCSQCSGQSYFRQGVSGNVSRAGAEGEAIVTLQKNQQPSGNGCNKEEFPPELLILPVGFSLMVAIYTFIRKSGRQRVDAPLRGHVCAADSGARDRRAHERKH